MYSRLPYSRGGYGRGLLHQIIVVVTSFVAPVHTTALRYFKAYRVVVSFVKGIHTKAFKTMRVTVISWVNTIVSSATSFSWITPWLLGVIRKDKSLTGSIYKESSLTGAVRKDDLIKGRKIR